MSLGTVARRAVLMVLFVLTACSQTASTTSRDSESDVPVSTPALSTSEPTPTSEATSSNVVAAEPTTPAPVGSADDDSNPPDIDPQESSEALTEALDRIDGQYQAVDAEPVGSVVDLGSIGATRFGGRWHAIGDTPDGDRIAFASDDGLVWDQLPREISGLPDDVRGPYQLWSLGGDLVLRGLVVDDSERELWEQPDFMVARSDNGMQWHAFPEHLSGAGAGPERSAALTTTSSLFAYASSHPGDRPSRSFTVFVLDADAAASEAPKAIDAPLDLAITALSLIHI